MKCVVVGDPMVGKTSLIYSCATRNGVPLSFPLIWDNYQVPMTVEGKQVILSLWDTAGPDDYDRLRPLSYPNTDIFLVCFSLVQPQSYENVFKKWYPELKYHCPNTPILLVGTKQDIVNTSMQLRVENSAPLTKEDGLSLCEDIGAVKYIECSAKTGIGLDDVFNEAVRVVVSLRTHKPQTWFNRFYEIFK